MQNPDLENGKDKNVILIIDDETSVRETTKTLLELTGFDVLLAESGEQAIETYKTFGDKVDAVLLDMTMPGMSGLDTLSELLKIDYGVKVIFASGDIGDADEELRALGARSMIQKPYKLKDLLQTINDVISAP